MRIPQLLIISLSNCLLIFANISGHCQSSYIKLFGDSAVTERGKKIISTGPNEYFLFGNFENSTSSGYVLSQCDSDFNLVWNRHYESSNIAADNLYLLTDSNFLLSGYYTDSIIFGPGIYLLRHGMHLLKTTQNGDTLWSKIYTANDTISNLFFSYCGSLNDTLIFVGSTMNSSMIAKGIIIYIDAGSGTIIKTDYYTLGQNSSFRINQGILDPSNRSIYTYGGVLDTTQFEFAIVYSVFSLDSPLVSSILIDDSVAGFKPVFIRNPLSKQTIIGYNTYKYQTALASMDFQFAIIDCLNNISYIKYIPNIISNSTVLINRMEFIPTNQNLRVWGRSLFFELDPIYNLISSVNILSNSPIYNCDIESDLLTNTSIKTFGWIQKTQIGNEKQFFCMKILNNGWSCYSDSLNINLVPGSADNIPLQINKQIFNQIQSDQGNINLSYKNYSIENYCTVTNIVNLIPNNDILKAFPNPTTGMIRISSATIENGNYTLKIFDALGAEIYNSTIEISSHNLEKDIDLRKTNAGIYFLQINNESFSKQIKIVKTE